MAQLPDQIFLGANAGFLVGAFMLTMLVLILASRHVWLVGYGPEQARVRMWMSVVLIFLTAIAIAAAAFNLFFSFG